MKTDRLEQMVKGWFVGDFSPTVLQTQGFEVAVKHYRAGDREDWHYHKVATEITVIVSGEVEMGGKAFRAGDIITLSPGEGTAFSSTTDSTTVVVKVPSVKGDKYLK